MKISQCVQGTENLLSDKARFAMGKVIEILND